MRRFLLVVDGHVGDPADIAEIKRIRSVVEKAVKRGDVGIAAEVFAEDIAMLPGNTRVRGIREAEESLRQMFERGDLDERFSIEKIVVLGDLAVEFGSYSYEVVWRKDGTRGEGGGRYLYTYERDASGVWLVHRMSWG